MRAADAEAVDTTELSVEEVVDLLEARTLALTGAGGAGGRPGRG